MSVLEKIGIKHFINQKKYIAFLAIFTIAKCSIFIKKSIDYILLVCFSCNYIAK